MIFILSFDSSQFKSLLTNFDYFFEKVKYDKVERIVK
jgi:hypothetical protein